MFIQPAYAQSAPGFLEGVGVAPLFVLLIALLLFVAYRRGRAIRLREEAHSKSNAPPATAPAVASAHDELESCNRAVFLSYRRDDAADLTGRLYDRLTRDLGRKIVFKDIDSIPLGSDFRAHIDDSLERCRVFLLVVGKSWMGEHTNGRRIDDSRDFIRLEVEAALRRNIPVIPVLVHGASIPAEETLPEGMRGIAYRQAIRLRPDPDFHRDVDRLIAFLEAQLKG